MMSLPDKKQLALLKIIETELKTVYENDPKLTDSLCELALDNAKIALKQQFGYALNETIRQEAHCRRESRHHAQGFPEHPREGKAFRCPPLSRG
jgi:hypothetical protein